MRGNLNELLKELPPDIAPHLARYGVRLAIDLLETFYTDLGGERQPEAQPVKIRVPKVKPEARHNGWSDNPDERSQEMRRRFAVRKEKAARERKSAAARKRWQKMSTAQKQAWMQGMQRGRRQRGKAEVAA